MVLYQNCKVTLTKNNGNYQVWVTYPAQSCIVAEYNFLPELAEMLQAKWQHIAANRHLIRDLE